MCQKAGKTSLCISRLLGLGEFDVALSEQIRFNACGQPAKGEKDEESNGSIGGGMYDLGTDGGAWLGPEGQSFAAKSAGEYELRAGRRQDDYGGLLEPARKRAQNLRWAGSVRGGVARGRQ